VSAEQEPRDPFHGQGIVPDVVADAAVTLSALEQLGHAEMVRAVRALSVEDLRAVLVASLLLRTSTFRMAVEDGELVLRGAGLGAMKSEGRGGR
jgi:hypothetical protein